MKEDFLQYLWKHGLFLNDSLTTSDKKTVVIHKLGTQNHHAGPDFSEAQVEIENLLWIGSVEVHVCASDWYVHGHESDPRYENVVLHVVWEDDVEVFDTSNNLLPTIVLSKWISKNILKNYEKLFTEKLAWIPCENLIKEVDPLIIFNWKTRLYFERLESKSLFIMEMLKNNTNDYEAVLFQLLMKNFGLKTNGEAFFNLANSFRFSVVRKEQNDLQHLNALLFGQAGFLDHKNEEAYLVRLAASYQFLKRKYKLESIGNHQFKFFRMRPSNFPTIRIAQIASLYSKHKSLFSKLMAVKDVNDYYSIFKIELHEFWQTHFTFNKTAKKRVKYLSRSFINLVIINTIMPMKFVYYKSLTGKIEDDFENTLMQLGPEKNSIVSKFSELNIHARNAMESQALLELKNNYCAMKRCLQCAIGTTVLKRV